MKKTISLTLVLALCLVAKADFTFGEPTLVPNVNSDYGDTYVRIAADGLSLYITSQRPGGYGDLDIWVAKRPTKNDEWGTPVNLGPKINTNGWDAGASISVDNLTLYFYSQDRPGGYGGFDLWLSTRETTEDDWGDPVNLGPTFNTTGHNWAPNISADNLSLYFTCDRPGGSGGFDMWMCARETIQGNWGTPVHLGFTVNWPYWDCKPDISADERTLFFTRTIKYYPGVDEDFDIWVTRRASSYHDWGEPVPLPINTSYAEGSTSISADGSTLYFMSNRPSATPSGDIWQVSIEPVVDLNSDGIVDAADMCIIVDHWGENYLLCDIGPTPLGDGVVDIQDLIVLVEYMANVDDTTTATIQIIYVDDDSTDTRNGSSWAHAFHDLQDALADAKSAEKPVEIRVAQGVYTPDQGGGNTPCDREATFILVDGVTLKGGFAGFGDPDPNARNIDRYETILSGDLAGNDIEIENPEDLSDEPTRAENSFHVVTSREDNPTAVLDGFTITGGNANGGFFNYGAGGLNNRFFSEGSSMTVLHCTFTRNSGNAGGAMYNNSSPILMNCTFSDNAAANGGGISNRGNPMLINCTFSRNCAPYHGSGPRAGGGMYNSASASPTLINCTFSENWANDCGGAMYNTGQKCTPTLMNCTFTENFVSASGIGPGGAIYNDHGSMVILTNCILWNNHPLEMGWKSEKVLPVATYSNIQTLWLGVGNIYTDPLFADPNNGDYHLKSQAGRWDPTIESWVQDDATSPCIDRGDPMNPIGFEPIPHGGIVNMGAYGGTAEASKSP